MIGSSCSITQLHVILSMSAVNLWNVMEKQSYFPSATEVMSQAACFMFYMNYPFIMITASSMNYPLMLCCNRNHVPVLHAIALLPLCKKSNFAPSSDHPLTICSLLDFLYRRNSHQPLHLSFVHFIVSIYREYNLAVQSHVICTVPSIPESDIA